MTMRISQRQTSTEPDEREIVDHVVEHVQAYEREIVVNYYVSLKAKRFVILAGPRDVDKTSLAQGLAEVLVGQPSAQGCSFQAHPWWATRTKSPGRFAIAHTQFNTLKVLDFIEAASANEAAGLSFPFFVGIKRMSPAEVECYFHDLPRGLLWLADASTARVNLPKNLYVTGTLDVADQDSLALSQEIRHATVVRVDRDHFILPTEPRKTAQRRADWGQRFAGSTVRRGDRARAKLTQILPGGQTPLDPLYELERRFGVVSFPPFAVEEAWLYLANAFDDDGCGLFVEPVVENLHIAQDYVLAQSALPYATYASNQWAGGAELWDEVGKYLAPRFPRAYAWIARLLTKGDVDSRRSYAMVPAVETMP